MLSVMRVLRKRIPYNSRQSRQPIRCDYIFWMIARRKSCTGGSKARSFLEIALSKIFDMDIDVRLCSPMLNIFDMGVIRDADKSFLPGEVSLCLACGGAPGVRTLFLPAPAKL